MNDERVGLSGLIKSKKFWIGIIGMVIQLIAALIGQSAEWSSEQQLALSGPLAGIIVTMIGGQAHQDHAIAKNGETTPKNGDSTE